VEDKFKEFIDCLKKFSIKDALFIERNLDRQYKALEKLHKNLNDTLLFFKLVITNALLSYQLIMKGEKYWEKFSEFFSKNKDFSYFEEFLSTYNKRFLNTKLKRLEKIKTFVDNLNLEKIEKYALIPELYLRDLARYLNQKPTDKTIVFSYKMLMYAYRIVKNEDVPFKKGIFIPLDSRLSRISKDKEFWLKLEKETYIPLLHLDSIIWPTFNLNINGLNIPKELKDKLLCLKKALDSLLNQS